MKVTWPEVEVPDQFRKLIRVPGLPLLSAKMPAVELVALFAKSTTTLVSLNRSVAPPPVANEFATLFAVAPFD